MSTSSMQSLLATSYLSGGNANYLEDIYEAYLKDPLSVDTVWQDYFKNLPRRNGQAGGDISHADIRGQFARLAQQPQKAVFAASPDAQQVRQEAAWNALRQAYQTYGHLVASTNPLHPAAADLPPELRLESYPAFTSLSEDTSFLLQDRLAALKAVYCGSIGAEFMYIRSTEERDWITAGLEKIAVTSLSAEEKLVLLQQLTAADGLEKYLANKYVAQKRFSLEGGDGFIPLLHALNNQAVLMGVHEIVIGMAHRGRLSTLINVLGKSPADLFAEFEGRKDYGLTSGDVKYHMGYASDIETPHGVLHVSLAFNPSHLEVISPVMMGSVRARQQRRGDATEAVLGVVVHGDASFAGQGVVMETLQMSQTPAYQVGGSVHVVINNQVGFTTSNPKDARSSYYCTDVAKMIEAPVFHVNGDDPEAVAHIARLAVEYRAQFHKDVVIDLVCYRRLGHNEADEPSATQPLMYQFIRQHALPREIYAHRLIQEKIITPAEVDAHVAAYRDGLDAEKPVVNTQADGLKEHYLSNWKPYLHQEWIVDVNTAVPQEKLQEIAQKIISLPPAFEVQRQVAHILAARVQMTSGELPLDWGYAETLAYASLLDEGYPVRLSGQDCRRGTFSHRHAVLHDQKTGEIYTPLSHIRERQAPFYIYDSLLSEMGVMGFEYGYASTDPKTLVLWEAQYGDFVNGAQMIIDQFISSAWQKWGTLSGLTLLLPHGYEGAGPEHTSARLERFLQLCAQENMQVCTPTTPAQIFHLLRRQVLRPYRTPLVIMTPKSMLRSKLAVSTLEELSTGKFQTVIPEIDTIPPAKVTRVVFCGGKVYYDLLAARRAQKQNHIALIRIEQLYPFPESTVQEILKSYKHAKELIWCQEEPENQGAWYTIARHRLEACLTKGQTLRYVGRPAAASPAAGYMKLHEKQQADLVAQAIHA